MPNEFIHYALSPVQGFVSQARRTKDLWSGSYLLSYLIAQAMKDLGSQNIIFPSVENDPLLKQSINPKTNSKLAKSLGSLPNRFIAIHTPQAGQQIQDAVNQTWEAIAQTIKSKFDPTGTLINQQLWDQQIKGLWNHQWVESDSSSALDQRKNLRTHFSQTEGGEKCTMCGEREELSPITPPLPSKINQWWKDNIQSQHKTHGLDLKDGERLCAVCFTKRMFPKFSKEAITWEVPKYYPSTAYLSVIDWIITLLDLIEGNKASPLQKENIVTAANEFVDVAKAALPVILSKAERRSYIAGIIDRIDNTPIDSDFAILDGDVFYLSSIQQQTFELNGNDQEQKDHRNNLTKALKKLITAIRQVAPHLAEPSPFYAILLMDGDGMGKLLGKSDTKQKQQLSNALATFTQNLPDIIKQHNGILTYAGGDDVFALLPVSSAMDCAVACRQHFKSSFQHLVIEKQICNSNASISAAIQYTHMNTALSAVVNDAHQLLDSIAKEKTGRDAVACRVWKRGGPILTWSQPWQTIQTGKLLTDIRAAFQTDDPEKFSSKLFYKLKDLFDLIQTSTGKSTFTDQQIKDLLVMEYLANRQHDLSKKTAEEKRQQAEPKIEMLLKLCQEHVRQVDEITGEETFHKGAYSHDGAMLIRFLSQKEV